MDSSKRLKSANGSPIRTTHSSSASNAAANLPAYQPPPQIGASSPDASRSSASIARPANGKTSLRLTVKAPPSKLRQATSGSSIPPNPYADTPSESDDTPAPAPRTARSTRNPRTVVDPDSEDEEDDALGEEEDEDEIEVDQTMNDEDSVEDAAGEDEDEEMEDDHPPPPVIRQAPGKSTPNVTVTAPSEGPLKSVEDKEMEDDDEEGSMLSELESNEGDGEGEEEDEEDGLSDEEDDENSRSATPDLTKLTKRQRGAFEEEEAVNLMALSNEAQKKKHLTAEEHAMRRAEMARRRKNLSEKRNEEEKMDTINKLLSKPAPKRRTRAEIEAAKAAENTPGLENGEVEKPDPLYIRYVNNRNGSRIGVTDEWLDAPIGEPFRRSGGGMVQEVA